MIFNFFFSMHWLINILRLLIHSPCPNPRISLLFKEPSH